MRLLPCGRYAAAGAHVAESAPVYALATRAAGEVEGVVTTRTHPWRQSSNSQTRWCSSSWAAGGLGFGVATVASCGLAAAEAQAEVVSEPREVPGALSNEHTAKWRLFTDEGRKRAAKGLYADAIKYMNRALQVTSTHSQTVNGHPPPAHSERVAEQGCTRPARRVATDTPHQSYRCDLTAPFISNFFIDLARNPYSALPPGGARVGSAGASPAVAPVAVPLATSRRIVRG